MTHRTRGSRTRNPKSPDFEPSNLNRNAKRKKRFAFFMILWRNGILESKYDPAMTNVFRLRSLKRTCHSAPHGNPQIRRLA